MEGVLTIVAVVLVFTAFKFYLTSKEHEKSASAATALIVEILIDDLKREQAGQDYFSQAGTSWITDESPKSPDAAEHDWYWRSKANNAISAAQHVIAIDGHIATTEKPRELALDMLAGFLRRKYERPYSLQ